MGLAVDLMVGVKPFETDYCPIWNYGIEKLENKVVISFFTKDFVKAHIGCRAEPGGFLIVFHNLYCLVLVRQITAMENHLSIPQIQIKVFS